MKIKAWIATRKVGSCEEFELEVDDNLTEEEIGEQAIDYILQDIDFGWVRINDQQGDTFK